MDRFLIVIEKARNNFSAYSPDLPGCIATGKTLAQVRLNMHTAMEMHLQGLRADKMRVPKSRTLAEYVAVKRQPLGLKQAA
ncbi:MAG: type II toxin-antitoxin system HicB family antitoxin [Chloroflexi bacterium]|nr:type II toxin-antitoxin system HicB family antitoxin [Chloroflexota bacterium]